MPEEKAKTIETAVKKAKDLLDDALGEIINTLPAEGQDRLDKINKIRDAVFGPGNEDYKKNQYGDFGKALGSLGKALEEIGKVIGSLTDLMTQ